MRRAKTIRIDIEERATGMLNATSPDMPEVFVTRPTIDGLMLAVKEAIETIMECRGEIVSVYPLEDEDSRTPPPWVIVPKEDWPSPTHSA